MTPNSVQRWTLALAALASFMVVLDMLVVATALSTIQRQLGATVSELEWTLNAYTLSFAVLLMTAAALGDRFGRRRLFSIGLAVFALASAACALSPSVGWLIGARAVQGAGAASIMPLALALLNSAFPPAHRGWAMGVFGGVTGLAALLGPVLGGAITQGLAWQWIFWLNVPIGLLAIPFVLRRVEESRGPAAAIDLVGVVLVSGAALGVVWSLVRGNDAGWSSPEVLGMLLGGLLLTAVFVIWERRSPAPMLPMRLFGGRAFSAGNAAIFLLNATLTGSVFFTAQFFQVTQGLGPLAAGLALLPWGLTPFLIAPRAGTLVDRIGERSLIVAGLVLQTVGIGALALTAAVDATYLQLAIPMTIAGCGFSIALPAVSKAVVSSVAPPDIGKAAGAFTMLRQLGGAFGVAIEAAFFAASGSFASPAAFDDGFRLAMAVGAALSLLGIGAGLLVPHHRAAPVAHLRSAAPAAAGSSASSGSN